MSALLEVRRDPGLISAPEKKERKKMEGQGGKQTVLCSFLSFEWRVQF